MRRPALAAMLGRASGTPIDANRPRSFAGLAVRPAIASTRLRAAVAIVLTPTSALWGLLLLATGTLGFLVLYSSFSSYDDEGYFLITIKGYLSGVHLFDQTAGAYGPFYWEVMGGLFKLFGLQVTNDGGRLLTLMLWIAAALLLALAAYALSGNPLVSGIVYVVGFSDISDAYGEPAHTSHLLMLLLALMVAITALSAQRRPKLTFALLGALAAATLLSKVNIGIFAFVSLVFSIVLSSPSLRRRRGLAGAVSVGFVLIPVLLMHAVMFQSGYLADVLHVTLGALAVVLVISGTGRREGQPDGGAASWLVYALIGAVVLTVLSCGLLLAQGTSLSGLFNNAFLAAYDQAGNGYGSPLALPIYTVSYDTIGVALAAAVALRAFPQSHPWPAIGAIGRIVAGIWIWISILSPAPFAVPVALTWIAAVPLSSEEQTPARRFVRIFIPALAILQTLHWFPVPGSQIRWGSFLFVIVGGVCVGDGLAHFGVSRLGLQRPAARLVAAGGLGLAIWVVITALVFPLDAAVPAYAHGTPVNIPGDTLLRLPTGYPEELEGVVTTLKDNCNTFITLPGLNSLYLMTGETPPTWENGSGIPKQPFSSQFHLIAQYKRVPRLCAVYDPTVEALWGQGKPLFDGPTRSFIQNQFHTIATFGEYIVYARNTS